MATVAEDPIDTIQECEAWVWIEDGKDIVRVDDVKASFRKVVELEPVREDEIDISGGAQRRPCFLEHHPVSVGARQRADHWCDVAANSSGTAPNFKHP